MADREGTPGIDGVDFFPRAYDWPPVGSAPGQCMSCGFLARRSVVPTAPGIEEVSVEDRKFGRLFQMADRRTSIPWCSVRPSSDVDLYREVQVIARRERAASGLPEPIQVSVPESAVTEVLCADRKCPEWWPYIQFLSPLEHRAERDMKRYEQERAALQVRLSELEHRTALYQVLTVVTIGVIGLILAAMTIGATLYPAELKELISSIVRWLQSLVQ